MLSGPQSRLAVACCNNSPHTRHTPGRAMLLVVVHGQRLRKPAVSRPDRILVSAARGPSADSDKYPGATRGAVTGRVHATLTGCVPCGSVRDSPQHGFCSGYS